MCPSESKQGGEHPEKPKGKPEGGPPEQVGESHGEEADYPWIEKEGPPAR